MINETLRAKFRAPKTNNSYFISFEGIEGSGKTTQIKALQELLVADGYAVDVFREPGGTAFGEKLREAILSSPEKISPMAEACLFASSRAQLLESKILPSLQERKKIVIVDRYIDSSLAYQGVARGLGLETILELHQRAPLNTVPHISVYLKIDLETSMERQKQRGSEKDYFEKEAAEFYQKLIQGYDEASAMFKERFLVIDGDRAPEEISREIETAISRLIQTRSN